MKFKFYFSVLLLLTSICLDAQIIDMESLEGMKIRNIGPAGMSGRVTAIDVDLSNTDRIMVGTASGGVWLSENGGISWEPIFDEEASISIGAIKINQLNPDEIWVGTGEGNPRNSQNSGRGVYKSIDGGKTWKCMGLEETRNIHRIIIHRDNPDLVLIGAQGPAWGATESRGVFKTTDGGQNWEKVLYVNDRTGIADMVADPNNPNKIVAAMWEFSREPWFFTSGGKGSGMYLSYDAGTTWKIISDKEGLPKGELGRIGIAFAPSKKDLIYALVEAKENGLYKSIDGGENWTLVSKENIGNRPFYYSELYIDPKNENRIYNLYTYISKSEDGGKTFETIADYSNAVHPDHHAFWIHPEDPSFLIDGNDGGVAISRDGAETWEFVANIPVGQFYHVNVDNEYPYNVYGGMQDNGSWAGPSYVLKSGGIRNNDWQELYFGDGFDVAPDPINSRYGYAMSQGGNIGRYDRKTGKTAFIKPVHPEGEFLRYNWNAALALKPDTDCGLYYGSQYVHYSDDCGRSWKIISPDLTTNDTSKQKQLFSGGLTYDATQAENYTTILSIAPSPVDEKVIWVGTDDGNLQLTRNGGENWTNLSSTIPGFPKGAWIPKIEVSSSNAGEAFVVVNNYRLNDWSAYLFHTPDFGRTWRRIADDEQVQSFVCAIIQDKEEPNLLFLGADDGLYVSFDYGENWNKWQKGFPSVQIRDFAIQERDADLVIGTFGRAFWVLDDIRPLRAIASSKADILNKELAIFEPPHAYQFYTRSYDGIRFTAQGEFIGENRSWDARIRVWKKKIDENKNDKETDRSEKSGEGEKAKKPKQANLWVIDSQGDTIRKLTKKLEPGINTLIWGMDRKGVDFPSLRERRNQNFERGGNPAEPGEYKLIIEEGEQKDSTMIMVGTDPRLEINEQELKDRNQILVEYEKMVQTGTDAFNQLKKAKKKVELIEKLVVTVPDSTQKELKEWNTNIKKDIDSLMQIYLVTEEVKGIQRDPGKLNSKIQTAGRYLGSVWGVPGQNAMNAMQTAKKGIDSAVEKVNEFIEGDWKNYAEYIEGIEFELLGKLERIENTPKE